MFRDTFEGEDLELLVKDNIFIDVYLKISVIDLFKYSLMLHTLNL